MDFGLIYTHFQLEDTFYLLKWFTVLRLMMVLVVVLIKL